MKKYLFTILALSAFMPAAAESPYVYGICTGDAVTVGTGKAGTNYSAAIEVPEAVAGELKGGRITAVSYAFGSGSNKNVEIFLSYGLDETPFYTQTVTREANTFNEVVLDTPYEIDGRPFYIGYNYRQTTANGKPVVVDGRDLSGMGLFSHLAMWTDKEERRWTDCSAQGALAIRATVEGARLTDNAMLPVGLDAPQVVTPWHKFDYRVTLLNLADTDVADLEIGLLQDNEEGYIGPVALDKPIKSGETVVLPYVGTAYGETDGLRVAFGVVKVNGRDNLFHQAVAVRYVPVSAYMFPRKVVIEEYTGVDCGWCPAGYVAMEQMRENHPDDYIGIAVHNYSDDPMRCDSYEGWTVAYKGGAPHATVNRNTAIGAAGIFNPQPATCESAYQQEKGMVGVCLDMAVDFAAGSQTELDVEVSGYFDHDLTESESYGFALVQTEDNVGPYRQYNGYAGGSKGEMFGFENMGTFVELIYNDVARSIEGWNGTLASVPAGLARGEWFRFSHRMPFGKPGSQKADDTYVIALLIDRNDGHIVTANRCRIGQEKSSAPALQTVPAPEVRAIPGGIEILGDYRAAEIYGIDGRKVASLRGESIVNLGAGLYVVRIDGHAVKVRI